MADDELTPPGEEVPDTGASGPTGTGDEVAGDPGAAPAPRPRKAVRAVKATRTAGAAKATAAKATAAKAPKSAKAGKPAKAAKAAKAAKTAGAGKATKAGKGSKAAAKAAGAPPAEVVRAESVPVEVVEPVPVEVVEPVPASEPPPAAPAVLAPAVLVPASEPAPAVPVPAVPAPAPTATAWAQAAWVAIRHPGQPPQRLAALAVRQLGPAAAEWADRLERRYPGAPVDRVARLARYEARRYGWMPLAAGVAGVAAPMVHVAATAWVQALLVLRVAAIYGHDPSDPARAGELIDLLGLSEGPARWSGGLGPALLGLRQRRNLPMVPIRAVIATGEHADSLELLAHRAIRHYRAGAAVTAAS